MPPASSSSSVVTMPPSPAATFFVAGQVIGVVITSSPGPTPAATSDRCMAAVPDESATACRAPTYSAKRRSSSSARGPLVSQPLRSVSATASISSSPTAGGWKERKLLRLDESLCIDRLEADELGRAVGAGECVVAALAAREHEAGAVVAAAEG